MPSNQRMELVQHHKPRPKWTNIPGHEIPIHAANLAPPDKGQPGPIRSQLQSTQLQSRGSTSTRPGRKDIWIHHVQRTLKHNTKCATLCGDTARLQNKRRSGHDKPRPSANGVSGPSNINMDHHTYSHEWGKLQHFHSTEAWSACNNKILAG